ncbi:hypothetical protein ACU635_37195 [[Actinomadura] parvosata]|uniref:hypothetical protein n=1 Tax=[Actinomadura] parvosata TaxID=1955412 RepID=UPI00406D1815
MRKIIRCCADAMPVIGTVAGGWLGRRPLRAPLWTETTGFVAGLLLAGRVARGFGDALVGVAVPARAVAGDRRRAGAAARPCRPSLSPVGRPSHPLALLRKVGWAALTAVGAVLTQYGAVLGRSFW